MDESRFDALTRTFALSRRQAIRLALGGSVAGLLGMAGRHQGDAARRGFSGPFSSTPTPTPTPTPESGCTIEGEPVPSGAFNTPQGCLICNPEVSTTEWTSIVDGSICGGVAGRRCCNGDCCSPTECCEGIGVCTECGPHCHIDGVDIDAGTVNSLRECEICDPERAFDAWSSIDDGRTCSNPPGCCIEGVCRICECQIGTDDVPHGQRNPNNDCEECSYYRNPTDWTALPNNAECEGDRRCCDGHCCPPDQCCTPDGCTPCCTIPSRGTVIDGDVNSQNVCQRCDVSRDPDDWSPVDNGDPCGTSNDQECCNGDCCPAGLCCKNGACADCGCSIDGRPFDANDTNDPNVCEICLPALDRFDWSAAEPGTPCDDDGGTCCGRDCCAKDQCCLLEACGECLCSIENEIYEPRDPHPDPEVECRECDPRADPFDWSVSPDGTACGDGRCCIGGTCQECTCLIDGVPVPDDAVDTNNPCQKCDSSLDRSGWTPLDDGAQCGDTEAQCCDGGQCVFCSCLIGEAIVPNETDNLDNECLYCDVALDPGNWSPRTETTVCGDGTQFCCNGVCCPVGSRCSLDDICEPVGCLIDGVGYADGTLNPRNRCQACNAAFPNQWSPSGLPDCPPFCEIDGQIIMGGTPNPANACQVCRSGNDWSPSTALDCSTSEAIRVCCNGVCCEAGACCGENGECGFDACTPQGCVIDGQQFEDGQENPNNPCQVCRLAVSTTSWTAQFGACGPTGEQFCCAGVCCELGACCNTADTCDFDACETCAIGGQLWFPEDRNPANGCEMCIANANKFAWTPLPDFSWCDEMQITTCCRGICCPAGEACRDGFCQPV